MDRNITLSAPLSTSSHVATREGGVDRNNLLLSMEDEDEVATREGGVDRNMTSDADEDKGTVVATREGGVDRNTRTLAKAKTQQSRHPRGWRG